MKVKKSHIFAFWTSTSISVVSVGLFLLISFFVFNQNVNLLLSLILLIIIFFITFFSIQYAIEKFIYNRLKKIYENVSLLDTSDLIKSTKTTNLDILSDEVQKFTENKQQQIVNLKLKETYRREYLGNISHELKTPLFTVQAYLSTLEDGAINNRKIGKKYLKRANKGVDRLISIVKDLDLISKLESKDLNLNRKSFNIVELTQDVFDLLEIEAKKRNVSLVFGEFYEYPITVVADKKRIEQVLTNLIVNSIKYGKINGTTSVNIEPYSEKKVLVRVKDTGEGISKTHLSRIFERFYRADKSRSREQGGSGLGLSIVKHIIEVHDEEIFVKSEISKGSEFSFTLNRFIQI